MTMIRYLHNTPAPVRRLIHSIPVLLIILASLSGCMSRTDLKVGEESELERQTLSVSDNPYPFDLFTEYKIQPGDLLDVLFQFSTWIERSEFRLNVDHTVSVKFPNTPELDTLEQKIRPDGTITLPYIGKTHVTGKTIDELTEELEKKFSETIRTPEIYILVPEFQSAINELKKDLHTAPRGLSRLVTVRPDGYATFPMVGDIFVGYRTIREVNNELNKLFDKVVQGLHCDLFLEKTAGTQIYLVGELKNPGGFNIVKPTTILEALALAGGPLPSANLDSVIVARRHENRIVATRLDVDKLLAVKKHSKFMFLQADDIVIVPKSRLANAAQIAQYIRDISFFNGYGIGFGWELHTED